MFWIKKNNTDVVDHQYLLDNGLISSTKKLVKVLGRGEFKGKVEIKLNKFIL